MSPDIFQKLLRAGIPRFRILIAGIPTSERKSIIADLQKRVHIMRNIY